jgi:hypothetical protein
MSSDFREKLFCIYSCLPLAIADVYDILVCVDGVCFFLRIVKMKIRISVVTPKDVVRSTEAVDVKEAKSAAMHIVNAKMVSVSFFDGEDIVQIECYPTLGSPNWRADHLGDQEKNTKFLKKFLKSAYAK